MPAIATISSNLISGTDVVIPSGIKPYFQVELTDLPQPSAYVIYLNGVPIKEGNWTFPQGYEARIPLTNLRAGTYKLSMEIGFVDGQTVTTNTAILNVPSYTSVMQSPEVIASNGQEVAPTLSLQMKYGIAGLVIAGLGLTGYAIYYMSKNK